MVTRFHFCVHTETHTRVCIPAGWGAFRATIAECHWSALIKWRAICSASKIPRSSSDGGAGQGGHRLQVRLWAHTLITLLSVMPGIYPWHAQRRTLSICQPAPALSAHPIIQFVVVWQLGMHPWQGWEVTHTKLGVSPSQLRWLGACQFQLHQWHWLNGSACDTCHKVLNVCSFQQDGWAHAAARGRMTFCVVRVSGEGEAVLVVAPLFLPPPAVSPSFLWAYQNTDK